jgi:Asparagine synthase (glutamine-hydrolyzing)
MALFAGIYSRKVGEPVEDSACEALRNAVSRNPADERHAFRDARCFFVKIDACAFGSPAFRVDEDGSASVLAGEPLMSLSQKDSVQSRSEDLNLLHDGLKQGDWEIAKNAQGTFCAAHYNRKTGKLFLMSDKLGVRPLYFWANEKFFVFATALRVLESLNEIPKALDLRGVTEMTGFGYPLGSRTPYANISLMRAAEIVEVEAQNLSRRQYWRWDEIEPARSTETELLTEAHKLFMRAVSRRQRADKSTIAYLSGGLDSRCCVAALRASDVSVHTFNFALPCTQDYIFGNEFAEKSGTLHEAIPKEQGDQTPDYSSLLARVWQASAKRETNPVERDSLVWSGEGGSVAFGHVHLSRAIVEHMRAGRTDEAIETFLRDEGMSVTRRLLQPDVDKAVGQSLHEGIREELAELHCQDPARSFYLFLMLNDQRRKLAAHFENLDLHRLEFQLPFFDAEFLSLVVSLPVELCLGHKFYTKWLELFPAVVTQVAWQTYPGHEPCPLPAPQGTAYQWDDDYQKTQLAVLKRELMKQSSSMLSARDFPKEILRKNYLRLASLIYQAGLRDYSYVIESAWKYYTYSKMCGGQYAQPSGAEESANAMLRTRAQKFSSEAELT